MMFKQEDAAFPAGIQSQGCYLFCLLRMCEIESGRELTRSQVLTIYADARTAVFTDWQGKKKAWIEGECSVNNPDMICLVAMNKLGCDKRIRQVGAVKNGKRDFWIWARRAPYNVPEYIAMRYMTGGPVGFHYVLQNALGAIIYDPSTKDYTLNPEDGGLLHKVI